MSLIVIARQTKMISKRGYISRIPSCVRCSLALESGIEVPDRKSYILRTNLGIPKEQRYKVIRSGSIRLAKRLYSNCINTTYIGVSPRDWDYHDDLEEALAGEDSRVFWYLLELFNVVANNKDNRAYLVGLVLYPMINYNPGLIPIYFERFPRERMSPAYSPLIQHMLMECELLLIEHLISQGLRITRPCVSQTVSMLYSTNPPTDESQAWATSVISTITPFLKELRRKYPSQIHPSAIQELDPDYNEIVYEDSVLPEGDS